MSSPKNVWLAGPVPRSALSEAIEEGEPYVINEEKCTECGSCSEVCPVEAIVEK